MTNIDIRLTDTFPEPEFGRLQRLAFADVQQYSDEWDAVLRDEAGITVAPHKLPPILRVGAYEGNALVGWSYGSMERGNIFFMAHSGVLPSHRRRGIYTALLEAVRDQARAEGVTVIRSLHSVLNNPIIIAKLRAGFNVSGLSQSAKLGTIVELTLHLSEKRQKLFHHRVLPYVGRDV